MPTLWITYAWKDNQDDDVDFVVQELERAGLSVRFDRIRLMAGRRLWEQISAEMADGDLDAWAILVSPASLSSEPCREELAYALERTHRSGGTFPVIGVFLGAYVSDNLPSALSTRLCVSTEDSDWAERVRSATIGEHPQISRPSLEPYAVTEHRVQNGDYKLALELRPRVGSWTPFYVAIPAHEKEAVAPMLMRGARGAPPHNSGCVIFHREGLSKSEVNHVIEESQGATPTMSYFLYCKVPPSQVHFGCPAGPNFTISRPQ